MPKLKTHKGAAKRFKITATGKVKRRKAGARHLLTAKSKGSKRVMRKPTTVSETHADAIKKLLPYG